MRSFFVLTSLIMVSLLEGTAAEAARSATISELKGEARIGEGKPVGKEAPAQVKSVITAQQYLRTGKAALVELKFPSGATTRVGAFSIFRFVGDKDEFILDKGEGLFVFPKGK